MRHPLPAALLVALAAAVHAADKLPPDPLDGPPFVSCKAWAIADGKTGKLLWGHDEEIATKAASTAKIMCATVVLELAAADPKVLDEIVTFSKYADAVPGSTADIRAGEQIAVRELLYGLLLPSGNDAGTALAEHFNARLDPNDPRRPDVKPTPRSNFIAQMNRAAVRLGMNETTYRSVFGDGAGADEMTISPRDLLTITHHAMQVPLFRQYVSTEHYECDVKQPDGSPRHAAWTNTNNLLTIEGYDGVKTGTTTSAGACLVSSGHRGDDHLLIVVLGSTSGAGRFVDTRNLFRWAWLQRGHK